MAPPFLISAQDGGELSALRPGHFTPGEIAPGTHYIGDWVDPRARLDPAEKRKSLPLPIIEPRLLNPSRYRLSYSYSYLCNMLYNICINLSVLQTIANNTKVTF
jgi:hypothetical protein